MACHIQGELNTLQHLYESLMSDSNKDQLKDGKNNKYKLSVGYEKFTFITNNISKSAENFYIYDADFLEETSLIINKIFMDATFRSVPKFEHENIQLLTIMGKIEGKTHSQSAAVPIFRAIMS
ncbi:GSCOCG00012632001-RA-CDS, partial [Cotesia congregata]